MHIVYIYKDYAPVMGGIESHLQTLAEGVAATGLRVSVVVCQPAGQQLPAQAQINGVMVYRVPRQIDIASSPISLGFWSIVRQLRPDLIHLQMPWPTGDAVAALFPHIPMVVTYQSDVIRQKYLLHLYAPLLRHTLRRAKRIIVTSPQYRDSSPWLQPFIAKCQVIPLGMPPAPAPDPARVAHWQAEFPQSCLLWVGRLRYYKGLHVLIAALAQLAPTITLALVGDGPEAANLRALATTLGVSARVRWLGSLPDVDVRALQAVAKLFVFPSHLRSEAFGLALLAALQAGLPAISCELGTATSFVNQHDKTGIVVAPADASALANAIETLWNDDVRRVAMAQEARTWARAQFGLDEMVEAHADVYQQIIALPDAIDN
ncbi:MAG: glycosyltransferase [Chloroflexales bacterium]|nr:glycosyltransferase [Chloroflexales bacterium]